MLDTSRHYYPPTAIKDTLEIMALAKFNVFHWHISDDDSFPLEIPKYPTLSKSAAFSAGEVYTEQFVKDIVAHAT